MDLLIPYDKSYQTLTCDDDVRAVITCTPVHGTRDGISVVREAMATPIGSDTLAALARGKKQVLLLTSDHTRPVPSHITIPLMLAEIRKSAPDAMVRILVATGSHRAMTRQEMVDKFSASVVDKETIIVHRADACETVDLGMLPSGAPCLINAEIRDADLIIADGFIEPHFFAGFSGGRKAVLPGIGALPSVMQNHCAKNISSPHARTGILKNNPIHIDATEAARRAGLSYIVNVVLDDDQNIVAAFAGEMEQAHTAACRYCADMFLQKRVPASVVITSNGGYPLDQNLYQSVKSMTAAEACVTEQGFIICVSACLDGSGGEDFVRWLSDADSASQLLAQINSIPMEDTTRDQWQSQILARVMTKAHVIVVSDPAMRQTVESMHMIWQPDVNAALHYAKEQLKDRFDGITVIPNGISVMFDAELS